MTDPSWLDPETANVYIVPKVPKRFGEELGKLLSKEVGEEIEPFRLDPDLSEWVVARASGKRSIKGARNPGVKALWRAFRALAAARYHFRTEPELAKELLEMRDRIEGLWIERT